MIDEPDPQAKLLQKIKDWSVRFKLLPGGQPLDTWQAEVVASDHPQLVIASGRKCGKTVALAAKIVWDWNKGAGKTVCILSKGQRQAGEVFETVKAYLAACGAVFAEEPTKTKMVLKNGYRILCLPSGYTGVSVRTYTFWKVYWDEAGHLAQAVYDATTPCLAAADEVYGSHQKILASTFNGTSGFFYDEFYSPESKTWQRSSEDCTRVSKSFLRKEKARMTTAEYAQEYLGVACELADSMIPGSLIAACVREGVDWADVHNKAGSVFIGVDFARFGKDQTALAFCYLVNGTAFVRVEMFKTHGRLTAVTGRIRARVATMPKWRKIVTDEGGIGAGPTDDLVEAFGRHRVLGINNARRVDESDGRPSKFIKADMYSNLIRMMEQGRVVLDDDLEIIRSLKQVKYDYTKLGDLRVFGKQHDCAEALVRSVYPLRSYKPPVAFFPVAA